MNPGHPLLYRDGIAGVILRAGAFEGQDILLTVTRHVLQYVIAEQKALPQDGVVQAAADDLFDLADFIQGRIAVYVKGLGCLGGVALMQQIGL